jgi:hypothetical protein
LGPAATTRRRRRLPSCSPFLFFFGSYGHFFPILVGTVILWLSFPSCFFHHCHCSKKSSLSFTLARIHMIFFLVKAFNCAVVMCQPKASASEWYQWLRL